MACAKFWPDWIISIDANQYSFSQDLHFGFLHHFCNGSKDSSGLQSPRFADMLKCILLNVPHIGICPTHWVLGDFNTLRPRQNGQWAISKCIFRNENVWISIKISLKFVPKGLINNNPALVHIVACCLDSTKLLFSQQWLVYWLIYASLVTSKPQHTNPTFIRIPTKDTNSSLTFPTLTMTKHIIYVVWYDCWDTCHIFINKIFKVKTFPDIGKKKIPLYWFNNVCP